MPAEPQAADRHQAFLERALDGRGSSIAALAALTTLVLKHAAGAGLEQPRAEHLALAVMAAEEVLHRDGDPDRFRLWSEQGRLVCEIRSSTVIQDPLAGRRPPSMARASRGLWLSNQLCDLVELRSSAAGTVARLHMVVGR